MPAWLALAPVVLREPVLEAHVHAAVLAAVRVGGGQLLLAAGHRAARLAVHPRVICRVAVRRRVPAAAATCMHVHRCLRQQALRFR